MICFITALKSQAVSNNWEMVSRLFEASLLSAYSQNDPEFRIIVVCHEIPKLHYSYDERVEFINVDFSPPSQIVTKLTMEDKWKKLQIGMVKARSLNPDFIMFMDADDLVSCRLSEYANSHKEANGWILKKGYRYTYGSRWIYLDDNFNCGTNSIVSSKLIKFPQNLTAKEISQCVVLTNGHTIIEKKLEEMGTPLESLPFAGAVYIHSHGDNDSSLYSSGNKWYSVRHFFRSLPRTRFLTTNIKEEFSLKNEISNNKNKYVN